MRYRFRLAQLLKYRKSIEDQRQIALAMIREKQCREEKKLYDMQSKKRSSQEQLRGRQGETALHLSYLDALSQESISQRRTLRELDDKITEAREELLEESKSCKIVEKLHDRQIEQHKQHILKLERKYLDEVAIGRFVRAKSK